MKSSKVRVQPRPQPAQAKLGTGHRIFRAEVGEGDVISFDPTGEQLRVSKIENGRITFEKLP